MKFKFQLIVVGFVAIAIWIGPSVAHGESFPDSIFHTNRNQPRLKQLFLWDGEVVAKAGESFFRIDLKNRAAVPIHSPGNREMISLTTALGRPWALVGRSPDFLILFGKKGERDWEMVSIPKTVGGNFSRIIGDSRRLVALSDDSFAIFNGKEWVSRKTDRKVSINESNSCVVFKNSVYLGINKGEFGGGLYALDLTTAKWSTIGRDEGISQVTDLNISPNGELKIVCGIAHLGLIEGALYTMSESELVQDLYVNHGSEPTELWRHPATSFQAIEFDEIGNSVVLGSRTGLAVFKEKAWERLTPTWSDSPYLESFLILGEKEYVIGTSDSGIAYLNSDTEDGFIITMSSLFTEW